MKRQRADRNGEVWVEWEVGASSGGAWPCMDINHARRLARFLVGEYPTGLVVRGTLTDGRTVDLLGTAP